MTPLRTITLALLALLGGCWSHIEDHCRGCTIVAEQEPDLPRLRADTPVTMIVVHGAFGFGDEWDPVIAALQRDKIDFFVWSWPGPFRNAVRSSARFTHMVQETLDSLPQGVEELVLLAHSAGGALVENAARRVRVPAGHRLRVIAIAPARTNLSPPADSRFSETSMGQSLAVSQQSLPGIPAGVQVEEYVTEDAPGPGQAQPDEPGIRRVYLGQKVGHNESVPLAALPIIELLSQRR